jgi:membrane protein DedA with SNARE-associated domain/rhodanese-related sulfurtransferase
MILVASQAQDVGGLSGILLAAVIGSLLADWIWYQAGRVFGYRVLSLLCKMSINPSSCVNQTEARFTKWGVWSLVLGKFIPGFSTVAPPVAGALGMPPSSFFIASAIGAGLWAGVALCAGFLFKAQIDNILAWLLVHGIQIVMIFAALIVIVISWKFWKKMRFDKLATIRHVSMEEMQRALSGKTPPHIIDLRNPSMVAETGRMRHGYVTEYDNITHSLQQVDKGYPIITVCACPQDAGAVYVAQELQALGYKNAFPLAGGFDTWQSMAQKDPSLLESVLQ